MNMSGKVKQYWKEYVLVTSLYFKTFHYQLMY